MFPFANGAQVQYWRTGTWEPLTLPALPKAGGRGGGGGGSSSSRCCIGACVLLLLIVSASCQGSYQRGSHSTGGAIDRAGGSQAITKKTVSSGSGGQPTPAPAAAILGAMTRTPSGLPPPSGRAAGGSEAGPRTSMLSTARPLSAFAAMVSSSSAAGVSKVTVASKIALSTGSKRSSGTVPGSATSQVPVGSSAVTARPSVLAQHQLGTLPVAAAPAAVATLRSQPDGPATPVHGTVTAPASGEGTIVTLSRAIEPMQTQLAVLSDASKGKSDGNERTAAAPVTASTTGSDLVLTRWTVDLSTTGTAFAPANDTVTLSQPAAGQEVLPIRIDDSHATWQLNVSTAPSWSLGRPDTSAFDTACPGFTRAMLIPSDCSNLTLCEEEVALRIDEVKQNQARGGFSRIIQQYDCRNEFHYSAAASCDKCEMSYNLWLCSTELQVYWDGSMSNVIPPCADVCDAVVKDCPYIAPLTTSVEPCFLCRDKHIEDGQARPDACYSFNRSALQPGEAGAGPRMFVRWAAASGSSSPLANVLLLLLLLLLSSLNIGSSSCSNWCWPRRQAVPPPLHSFVATNFIA